MKWIRSALSVLVMISLVVSLMACSGQNSNVTTASQSKEKPKLKAAVLYIGVIRQKIYDEYYKTNVTKELPNIEVEFETAGSNEDYDDKLRIYNAAGELPDVFWNSSVSVGKAFIEANNLLELTDSITKSGWLGKFLKPDVLKYNNKIYTLGSGVDQIFTPRVFYNKTYFTKNNLAVPASWNDFLDVCAKIKADGKTPIVGYGFSMANSLFQLMVMANNPQDMTDLMNDPTKIDSQVYIDALDRIADLAKKGYIAQGILTLDQGDVEAKFYSQDAPIYINYSWQLPTVERESEKAGFEADFMPFPFVSDAGKDTAMYWGTPLSGMCVFAKSEHPEEAVRLAEFLCNQDAIYFRTVEGSPTLLDPGVEIEGMTEFMKKNIDMLNNAENRFPAFTTNYLNSEAFTEFGLNFSKLMTGEFSGKEFVTAVKPFMKK
jgi:raffinose/stachyose/melibiose transport system substrate-binding protein